ncbi:MAG: hypothetical protein IPN68_12315 [Bacteroidetes bacterium]|nr:hypothetical protein [Bacteroidota bacterium]
MRRRFNLIHTFLDKKPLNLDYLFDATLNRSSFSIQQISEMICSMYEKKIGSHKTEQKKSKFII